MGVIGLMIRQMAIREAVKYVREELRRPWLEAEEDILSSIREEDIIGYAEAAYRRGGWPAGERELLSRHVAGRCSVDVLVGYLRLVWRDCRWEEAGPYIAKDLEAAKWYITNVLHYKRFPEAEPVLAKDTEAAVWYACEVLHGPFPAGEAAIAKNAETATNYAVMLARRGEGRFKLGEPVIMRSPKHAVEYAEEVIKWRWPEAEPEIAMEYSSAARYAAICKLRWGVEVPQIIQDRLTAVLGKGN